MNPLVTIGIPVWNGEDTLERLLQSLQRQTYRPIEVIVVDDASTDRTPAILQRYPEVRVVRHDRNCGMTISKNDSVRGAKGAYAFFVDDDMELVSDAVEQCVRHCETEGWDALIVGEGTRNAHAFWARCRGLDKAVNWDDFSKNCSRFMRRAVIERVGERDPALVTGDEYDFESRIRAAGFKVSVIRDSLILHDEPDSLVRVAVRSFHYGTTAGRYLRKRPVAAVRQFGFPRLAYVRNARVLLRNPALTLGWLIFKLVQLSSGVLGLGYAMATGRWFQGGQA